MFANCSTDKQKNKEQRAPKEGISALFHKKFTIQLFFVREKLDFWGIMGYHQRK